MTNDECEVNGHLGTLFGLKILEWSIEVCRVHRHHGKLNQMCFYPDSLNPKEALTSNMFHAPPYMLLRSLMKILLLRLPHQPPQHLLQWKFRFSGSAWIEQTLSFPEKGVYTFVLYVSIAFFFYNILFHVGQRYQFKIHKVHLKIAHSSFFINH